VIAEGGAFNGWTPANWAVVGGAAIALVGVLLQAWQKAATDRREVWWQRAQWAMERLEPGEHTPDADVAERRKVAIRTIDYLTTARIAGPDEYEYFAEVMALITGVPNPPGGQNATQ
jgi:hypothetical protein